MSCSFSVCQNGFSSLLASELQEIHGVTIIKELDNAVIYQGKIDAEKLAFPHYHIPHYKIITGESVNSLAGALIDYYIEAYRDIEISESWPLIMQVQSTINGLARRAKSVTTTFKELLKKRMSRVSKLISIQTKIPQGTYVGLFVYFNDFNEIFVTTSFYHNGQTRMADDPLAPSRSYLKVEEAYHILNHEPQSHDVVVDLGAAPGGWSYSAAKRGASVLAIDNGPLKAGAKEHELIKHYASDAFKFQPPRITTWLFCDMVEEPHKVLDLIKKWFREKQCQFFVVNLKFGHVNPIALLKEIQADDEIQTTYDYRILHLYHDRDEFTMVGRLRL